MEPRPHVPSVEFEHRRFVPPVAGVALPRAVDAASLPGYVTRVRVVRAVVVLLGALAIALATQRAGVGLSAALCVFLGLLPVLWIAGWLGGFALTARRFVAQAKQGVQGLDLQAELARHTRSERVRLEVHAEGLRVVRRGAADQDDTHTWPWQQVSFTRPGPQAAVLHLGAGELVLGPGELLELPASAFPDAAAFDAFCLELQGRVWATQR